MYCFASDKLCFESNFSFPNRIHVAARWEFVSH